MMQFCPNCGKWYDVSGNICPVCRSQLLAPNNNVNQVQSNPQPQQASQFQEDLLIPIKVEKKYKVGKIMVRLALVVLIIFLIFEKLIPPVLQVAGLVFFILSAIIGVVLMSEYQTYQNKIHAAEIAQKWEDVKTTKDIIRKQIAQQNYTNTHKVECPYCHSPHVQKIGTLNRAGSIFFAGLASSKIGKQWHCNDCNSDF